MNVIYWYSFTRSRFHKLAKTVTAIKRSIIQLENAQLHKLIITLSFHLPDWTRIASQIDGQRTMLEICLRLQKYQQVTTTWTNYSVTSRSSNSNQSSKYSSCRLLKNMMLASNGVRKIFLSYLRRISPITSVSPLLVWSITWMAREN